MKQHERVISFLRYFRSPIFILFDLSFHSTRRNSGEIGKKKKKTDEIQVICFTGNNNSLIKVTASSKSVCVYQRFVNYGDQHLIVARDVFIYDFIIERCYCSGFIVHQLQPTSLRLLRGRNLGRASKKKKGL